MTALHHIIIAVCYTLLAAACAVALPMLVPAIDPNAGAMIGGVVLIASALVHEVFARQEGEARLVDEVEYLRVRNAEIEVALETATTQLSTLREAVAEVSSKNDSVREDGKRSVETVISEVKVLQGLIEQFSTARIPGQSAAVQGGSGLQGGARLRSPAELRGEAPESKKPVTLVASEGAVVTPPPDLQSLKPAATRVGDPTMATGLNDDEILTIVRDGLEMNRVDLVLQPIVKLPNRRRVFFEAFSRIRDENGAILVPEQYIGIAERDGLVVAIDNMLLFRCVQLVRRAQKRDHDIGFFCNISAHSLTDRHFFSNFVEFMADNASLAPNLIFEFPYATIANRDHDIEQHLRQLAQLGFRFSVDQVYGLNLDYDDLAKHYFKYIKMDAEILLKEVRDPSGQIAVQDIKRIIDRHGIDLIVEKIETERDLLELLDLRIDYGQGYLFGKPKLARPE